MMQNIEERQTSGYVSMQDGGRIHYVRKGEGVPLILLHGNGQSLEYFKDQMALPFDIIAIDTRNHGKSSSTKALSFELMAHDILTVLDTLAIKSAHILGFSDGANLAMVFAKYYPERVDKLVLNSGNLTVSDLCFFSKIMVLLQHFFLRTPVTGLLVKDIGIKQTDLEKFNMPVLVIVGQYDMIKQTVSKRIAKSCHGQFVKIAGGFHKVSHSKAKQFNRIVMHFLQETYEK